MVYGLFNGLGLFLGLFLVWVCEVLRVVGLFVVVVVLGGFWLDMWTLILWGFVGKISKRMCIRRLYCFGRVFSSLCVRE